MGNFNSKSKVAIAANPVHRFPLHSMHLTTQNFMSFRPAFIKELPKSKIKYNHQSFVRALPLKKPMMTNIQCHNSAYFIPMRTIWNPWTDFITDTPHNQPNGTGIISHVPLMTNDDLITLLMGYSSPAVGASSDAGHDYRCDTTSTPAWFDLLPHGKFIYSTLNALGIRPNFRAWGDKSLSYSALPLLALCKVYQDYYYPNAFAHYGLSAWFDGITQREETYTLTSVELDNLFNFIEFVSYDSDYFTSAFENPVGGVSSTFSVDFNIIDITNDSANYRSRVTNAFNLNSVNNGTPTIMSSVGSTFSPVNTTQYVEDTLKALTNYIRRHQLSGSRSLERYLADWGVALSADKLQRCIHIGTKKFPVQVGDVMSTSDTIKNTDGAQLGDYAGKAVAFNGDGNWEYDTDEFGYFIVINTIVPEPSYVQGNDYANAYHKTKLDFLTGDFDGLGNRALLPSELFVGMFNAPANDIFAFTPMYSEYKIPRDILGGSFLFGSENVGLQGWDTCRLIADESGSQPSLVHSLNFVLGVDRQQYHRIFQKDIQDESDPFIVIHRSNYELDMPAVPLYDYYDFEKGKEILMDVNGVKQN